MAASAVPADAIAAILTSTRQVEVAPAETPGLADLPLRRPYKGASFEAAFASARAHCKRTLDNIKKDLLARSSSRLVECRVGMPVEPALRQAAKRLSRAVTRGLISRRLKESYDPLNLASIVQVQ